MRVSAPFWAWLRVGGIGLALCLSSAAEPHQPVAAQALRNCHIFFVGLVRGKSHASTKTYEYRLRDLIQQLNALNVGSPIQVDRLSDVSVRRLLSGIASRQRLSHALPLLREMAQHDPDVEVRSIAISSIGRQLANRAEAARLAAAELDSTDPMARIAGLKNLGEYGSESDMALVRRSLEDSNPRVVKTALHLLLRRGDSESLGPVQRLLKSENSEVREMAESALESLEPQRLIEQLHSSDFDNKLDALRRLNRSGVKLPKTELNSLLASRSHLGRSGQIDFQLAVGKALRIANYWDGYSIELLKKTVNLGGGDASAAMLEIVARPPSAERSEALKEAVTMAAPMPVRKIAEMALYEETHDPRYHRLYQQIKDPAFFRATTPVYAETFYKTGPPTYLLSGALAGKVVARVVPRKSLERWQHAYRSEGVWRAAGFERPPVERPLTLEEVVRQHNLSARDRSALMALESKQTEPDSQLVFTEVLPGFSLADYEEYVSLDTLPDTHPLSQQRRRIERTLVDLGVVHGHSHRGNFVITQEGGSQNVTVIDFDRAEGPE